MVYYFENHCTECDWSASTEECDTREEIGRAAIEHYVTSGHAIASRSLAYPTTSESEPIYQNPADEG